MSRLPPKKTNHLVSSRRRDVKSAEVKNAYSILVPFGKAPRKMPSVSRQSLILPRKVLSLDLVLHAFCMPMKLQIMSAVGRDAVWKGRRESCQEEGTARYAKFPLPTSMDWQMSRTLS